MPTELDTPTTDKIEFLQYHKPALPDGKYEIIVTQEIQGEEYQINGNRKPFSATFSTNRTFFVSGERFELKPTDIHAVFPPPGSLGEHANVLPHIILNRSTLPWERSVDPKDSHSKDIPWLFLLLFEDEEKPTPQVIPLKQLKNPSSGAGKFPQVLDEHESEPNNQPFLRLEPGQRIDDKTPDKVTIIDVKKSLLQKILPTKEDLAYLAHVRQGKDSKGNLVGDELAVIIGNRLPKKAGISTVHLVSLEGRYNSSGFDYQTAADNDLIRLVSLKSWSFACIDKEQSFKALLKNLNREPSTLRLPTNTNPEAEKYLANGYIPLPHYLRQGDKTISWYHSPLIPGENPTDITLPVRAADELVRYNPANGIFDISYAAAWELGRLLALQSKDFSINLYNWKRTHAQQLKQAEQKLVHLPTFSQPAEDTLEIPDAIASWFTDLSLLKGVPFNYLVPDEQMLPTESIRFFWVDSQWIECLLDGAFSIGRVTDSDHKRDNKHKQSPAVNPHAKVTGFLLRSSVVAGWPGLLVDGYNDITASNKLKLLRMERLSANVLLCLFNGEVKTVDIHQKPETLHFGLDSNDGNSSFYKQLRDSQGNKNGRKIDQIPWKEPRKEQNKRVINITQLADTIQQPSTSAQFALEMIEGVDKVRFAIAS